MRAYRLEFEQPDGRWTGPYCSEYMTVAAFRVRDRMLRAHRRTRRFPDAAIFAQNGGADRYVCATATMRGLLAWFGGFLPQLLRQGGRIAVYEVPAGAVAEDDGTQLVYQQRRGVLVRRGDASSTTTDALERRVHPSKEH